MARIIECDRCRDMGSYRPKHEVKVYLGDNSSGIRVMMNGGWATLDLCVVCLDQLEFEMNRFMLNGGRLKSA